MRAILEAVDAGTLDATISVVLSDNPQAKILDRARQRGLPTGLLDCQGFRSRFPVETQRQAVRLLRETHTDIVCLAGFMRLIGPPLLVAFPGRILNIHPSLLPAFPGLHAWQQALEAGVEETGCTIHVVDEGMDTGPVLAQARVPVLRDDTAETLHARIQEQEHRLYPEVIGRFSSSLAK